MCFFASFQTMQTFPGVKLLCHSRNLWVLLGLLEIRRRRKRGRYIKA